MMDYYHSIIWPMVKYQWKTINSNGCQTKNPFKTIEPNECQTKKPLGPMADRPKTIKKTLIPMVDRPKTIKKPLIPMVASKPFIEWQWWPWKPLLPRIILREGRILLSSDSARIVLHLSQQKPSQSQDKLWAAQLQGNINWSTSLLDTVVWQKCQYVKWNLG